MKPQKNTPDYSDFLALHKHQGTENYEVAKLIPKEHTIDLFLLDRGDKNLIVNATWEKINKDFVFNLWKIDSLGINVEKIPQSGRVLKEGTFWRSEWYFNWIINGDTTKHEYIYPLSEDERKDPEKWIEKFQEFYTKASYIYVYMGDYYFKIDGMWYLLEANRTHVNLDFKKQYPPKEDQDVRMVELPDLTPGFSVAPEKRDTFLLKEIGYKSLFFEKIRKGMDKYNYSAGYWYLDLYMPLGDTVKIRRYSDARNPRLSLYKIPSAQGGRNDVVFVVLEPNEVHPEQAGGMYVVRPRDPNQPQHRYKSKTQYIYKGEVVSEEIIETEEYIRWKARKK